MDKKILGLKDMNLKRLRDEWQILLFSPWLIFSMNLAICQGHLSDNGNLYPLAYCWIYAYVMPSGWIRSSKYIHS